MFHHPVHGVFQVAQRDGIGYVEGCVGRDVQQGFGDNSAVVCIAFAVGDGCGVRSDFGVAARGYVGGGGQFAAQKVAESGKAEVYDADFDVVAGVAGGVPIGCAVRGDALACDSSFLRRVDAVKQEGQVVGGLRRRDGVGAGYAWALGGANQQAYGDVCLYIAVVDVARVAAVVAQEVGERVLVALGVQGYCDRIAAREGGDYRRGGGWDWFGGCAGRAGYALLAGGDQVG